MNKKLEKLLIERRKYPKIICDDKELLSDIGSFLGIRKNIKSEFGKTLLSLGFNKTDNIVLCKYNRKTFTFNYIVNGCNPYKKNTMSLNCGYDDGKPKLILTTGTRKTENMKIYRCSRNNDNRINNEFVVIMEDKKLSNGINYCVDYSNVDILIDVNYPNNYCLRIELEGPYDGLLSEYYEYFDMNDKLRDEEKLINILINLEFPVEIEDIYKDICDNYFNDISIFSKFILSIEKQNDNKYLNEVVSKIDLRDGILKEFIITRNGKRITIDNKDNWQYEINNNGNILVLDYKDEQLTSGIIYGNKDNSDNDVLVSDLSKEACEEVVEAKTLVRKMLDNKGGNYDR